MGKVKGYALAVYRSQTALEAESNQATPETDYGLDFSTK